MSEPSKPSYGARLSRPRGLRAMAVVALVVAGVVFSAPTTAFADTTTVTVGDYPHGVAVSPDGSRVYVAAAVPGGAPGRLVAVDTVTDAVIGEVPVGVEPFGVVVSPDGATVYVANSNSDSITAVDAATLAVLATWPAPNGPWALAIDSTGGTLYASMRNGNRVDAFDTALGTVAASYPTGGLPAGLALDSASGYLYVAESAGNTVRRIMLADGSSTALPAFSGSSPYFLRLNGTVGELWVSPYIGTDLAVVDTGSFTVEAQIPIAGNARGMVFTTDGRAYINASDQSAVVVVDVATRAVLGTIPVGSGPEAIALAGDGLHAWTSNLFGASVSLVGPPLAARPADATVVDESEVTFSSTIVATFDSLQWQVSTDNGASWSDVPGATSPTLSFTAALAADGNLYRIVAVSALFGDTASEPATLSVTTALPVVGVDAAIPAVIALALAVTGLILVRARRSRSHSKVSLTSDVNTLTP